MIAIGSRSTGASWDVVPCFLRRRRALTAPQRLGGSSCKEWALQAQLVSCQVCCCLLFSASQTFLTCSSAPRADTSSVVDFPNTPRETVSGPPLSLSLPDTVSPALTSDRSP